MNIPTLSEKARHPIVAEEPKLQSLRSTNSDDDRVSSCGIELNAARSSLAACFFSHIILILCRKKRGESDPERRRFEDQFSKDYRSHPVIPACAGNTAQAWKDKAKDKGSKDKGSGLLLQYILSCFNLKSWPDPYASSILARSIT